MAEQHVRFLEGIGVDKTVIDALENVKPEEAKDFKADEHVTKVKEAMKGSYKTVFENDPEFLAAIPEDKVPDSVKKKVEAGQVNRFTNEMKEVAKKEFGFTDADFDDMTKDEKASLIKTLTRHITTKYHTKKGGDKSVTEMQEQVRKLNEDLEKKDVDWQEKLKTELEGVNGKAASRMVKALAKSEIASLADVELNVPAGYITDPILAKLTSKYSIVVNDNDELELRQKENPKLKVLDGSKEVTFQDALKKQILEDKVGKVKGEEDTTKDTKKTRVRVGGEEGNDDVSIIPDSIQAKIDKNIAAESKAGAE